MKFRQFKIIDCFLAPLAKGHESLRHGAASIFRLSAWRQLFLYTTSQEPLGQFQPNLVGNMLRGW